MSMLIIPALVVSAKLYEHLMPVYKEHTSKYELDKTFLTNQIGVSSLTDLHTVYKEYKKVNKRYQYTLTQVEKLKNTDLAQYEKEVKETTMYVRNLFLGFLALTGGVHALMAWDGEEAGLATYGSYLFCGGVLLLNHNIDFKDNYNSPAYLPHWEKSVAPRAQDLNASKIRLESSIAETTKVSQLLGKKLEEYKKVIDDPKITNEAEKEEARSLYTQAQIQQAKVNFILADVSLLKLQSENK